MRWLLVLTLAACSHCTRSLPGGQWQTRAAVVRHIDGDTIVVRTHEAEEKVRVKGIDCPESRSNAKCRREGDCAEDAPLGERASRLMAELAPVGQEVRLVAAGKQIERDRYGRLLAYIERGQADVGLELIRSGLCEDFGHKYPHPRMQAYRAAQARKQ